MKERASVFLIGPRASGKTTLGRRLAEQVGFDFVDADAYLEKDRGRRIADWVVQDRAGFRQAEASYLPLWFDQPGLVVALGGGIVETESAVQELATYSRVLGLRASLAELVARQAGGDRPALTSLSLEQETEHLWRRRLPAYERACQGRWVDTGGDMQQAWQRLWKAFLLFFGESNA
ncbi:MAG: shikimate kinase [Planctomycetota bacterium]|nr:MAG: shikimate kinase [Planctomycetota bacterium]